MTADLWVREASDLAHGAYWTPESVLGPLLELVDGDLQSAIDSLLGESDHFVDGHMS